MTGCGRGSGCWAIVVPVGRRYSVPGGFGSAKLDVPGHIQVLVQWIARPRQEAWRVGRTGLGPVQSLAQGPVVRSARLAFGRIQRAVDVQGERTVGDLGRRPDLGGPPLIGDWEPVTDGWPVVVLVIWPDL